MSFKRLKITIYSVFVLMMITGLCHAVPYASRDGEIYGHRSPNGTTSFFAEDTGSSWFGGNCWNLSIHRAFLPDGKMLNYIFAEIVDGKVKKTPVTGISFAINNNQILLEPMERFKPYIQDKTFRGWYIIPEEAVKSLENAETISLTFNFAGASPKVIKIDEKVVKRFRNLPLMQKENYVREGKVFGSNPELDLSKQIVYPSIFIPNAKPEDVKAALVYHATFEDKKGKEEFLYYQGHSVTNFAKEPAVFELEECKGVGDGYYSLVTVKCSPYKDGTFVTMGLVQKLYSYYGNPPTLNISYSDYVHNTGTLFNMSDYWRSKAERWARILLSIHHEYSGVYSYGFTWHEVKDTKKGPFKLATVNSKDFPELAAITQGDFLIAINKVTTDHMQPLDLNFGLDSNAGPVMFTFKTQTGEEKQITITPKLLTPKGGNKDYKKIVEGIPKKFTTTSNGLPSFTYGPAFDPLDTE